MPLIHAGSRDAIAQNIRTLRAEGKPQDQSVAIAMRLAQQSAGHHALGGMAHGGTASEESGPPQFGLISSSVPGRTDRHNMDLPSGSYVVPADVVAGLGEGNSMAGASVIDKMLHSSPWGIKATKPGGGVLPRKDYAAGRPGPYRSRPTDTSLPDSGDADGLAQGGTAQDMVPVVVAGGEYIIDPDTIAHHHMLGGLDINNQTPEARKKALAHGHRVLDSFILHRRAKDIKTLSKLPGPKK